jgi:hypothetical protein
VSNIGQPGIIYISFAGSKALITNVLAKIQFNILTDKLTQLKFGNVDLYNSELRPLTLRIINGEFRSWAIPPEHSDLLQNFPNPFNPETWIPFQLNKASEVTIRIYKSTGEMVRQLDLGYKPAGTYMSQDRAIYWDGKDSFGMSVASGVYFYNIQTIDFSTTKKMIVLR